MRRAAKVDDNQGQIVKALRSIGAAVEHIKKPLDLLVWFRGRYVLMEVKNKDGKNELSKDQVEFIARWPGEIQIVYTPEEAIAVMVGAEATK